MKVKTRKAKNYTSILLQEISEQAFSEAMNVYNSLEGLKVFECCERVGHLWEDDSFAGPESGYMGVSCTRCGYSEGSYLY